MKDPLDTNAGTHDTGTGLGLSISRALAQLMGGDVWASSAGVGQGTTVCFTAKLQLLLGCTPRAGNKRSRLFDTSQGEAIPPVSQASSDSNVTSANLTIARESAALPVPLEGGVMSTPSSYGKVLLVEDNKVNLKICTSMLRQLGVDIVQAIHGNEAIERCQEQQFALILMDLQMPICDGFTATKAIRRGNKLNNSTPILALTANVGSEEQTRAFAVGMDGFLSKPYSRKQLGETLSRYMKTGPE